MLKKIKSSIHRWSEQRLSKIYKNEPHQHAVFRCSKCQRIVTRTMLLDGKGCVCGGLKVAPSNFTIFEEIRILFMPWSIRGINIDIHKVMDGRQKA